MQSSFFKPLLVSPHYDDAVFSCGGILAQATTEAQWHVLNIFSCSGKNTFQRKLEEENVSQYLNYQSYSFDFPDYERRDLLGFLPFRMHRFLSTQDQNVFHKVKTAFLQFIEENDFSNLYFPLGVGMHVDHLLCFNLAKCVDPSKYQIFFYEDLPYALLPTLLELRLFQLGMILTSDFEWNKMMHFLYSRPVWQKLEKFQKILNPLLKKFWQKRCTVLERLPLKKEEYPLLSFLDQKNRAACLYESQIKDFFFSAEDAFNCFKQYSEKTSPENPAERLWQWIS